MKRYVDAPRIAPRFARAVSFAAGMIAVEGVHAQRQFDDQPQGSQMFAVPHHVIAAGGGRSSGGVFAIAGTIGQADADPLHPATGGVFAITGGFWPGIAPALPVGDAVFANGFEPSVP